MLRKFFTIFLLFLILPSQAQEEIIVHLSSSVPCCKTYVNLNGIDKEAANVLKYDISHNGFCLLTKEKNEADFIIEGKDHNGQLLLTAEHTQLKRKIALQPLLLTGDLSKDRVKFHTAADLLCKEFFGISGIARSRILYAARKKESSDSTKWTADLWIADYDGANAKRVTNENALCVTPTLLPSKIGSSALSFFYVSYREGEPKIFLGNQGMTKRLTYMLGNQLMPAISRQLDQIAFISTVHGREDLFIQAFSIEHGVTGKAKKLFSAPMATQGTPTFSPDGKKIAFVSNKDGTARIYLMKIPRNHEERIDCPLQLISKKNRENTAPNWSQDGRKIAYSALTNGVRQIWIYHVDKEIEEQLTFGEVHKENPVWAADSLHLLYNTASYENAELYMMDINQRRPTKITMGPEDKRFPAWEG